ncbi:MAG: cation:proton antiporter [Lentisphaeria bacterium]|nr:cation:proton antiporter [Lentisphaeria bacterium]
MLNFHLSVVQQISILVLQLGIIIFAARLCGNAAKKIKLPSVLGELLAGIIIGPCLLGGIGLPLHGLENGLFGIVESVQVAGETIKGTAVLENVTFQSYHSSLYAIATVGSILLLFVSGLETDLRMFIRYSIAGTLVGIGGVIFSFVFGAGISVFMLGYDFMHPCSLFLGILSTATSVGITARILSEQKKIDTPEGVTTLAAAVIDDVLGIICLAVVLGIATVAPGSSTNWGKIGILAAKCVGFWLIATAAGLLLAGRAAQMLKKFKSPVIYSTLAFGLALILAGFFEQQGLAMIIGAYVTGLSLSKTDVSFALQQALEPLYTFIVPIFFTVMGMLVDIRVFADMNVLKIGLIYSALAIAAKVIGCAIPALFMNFTPLGALRIGTGMVPRGEVALIIAGIGMTTMYDGKPVLTNDLFGVAIIMTLITTVLAPPLLNWVLNMKGKSLRKEEQDFSVVHTPFSFSSRVLTRFTLDHLVANLNAEGYMLSSLDKESGVLQIRKNHLSFALTISGNELVFESNPDELPFIKALMCETIVNIHQELESLKELGNPEDFQKMQLTEQQESPVENSKAFRKTIAEALNKNAIICDLKARDKSEVIQELIQTLVDCGKVSDAAECFNHVMLRESAASTCLQNGIALPHCRTNTAKKLSLAIGINRMGYNFDALDGNPSKIFILCVSPEGDSGPHIECLAAIATLLSNPETVNKILDSSSAEEIYDIFKG